MKSLVLRWIVPAPTESAQTMALFSTEFRQSMETVPVRRPVAICALRLEAKNKIPGKKVKALARFRKTFLEVALLKYSDAFLTILTSSGTKEIEAKKSLTVALQKLQENYQGN
jgi:hypothetical protein